jgi:hypothetical protein
VHVAIRLSVRQSRSGLGVDAVLCLEVFGDEEGPGLVDAEREELALWMSSSVRLTSESSKKM